MLKRVGCFFIGLCLSACSSVDSLKPFDQQQAAHLLQQHHTTRATQQRIQLSLPNKHQWQRIDMSYGTVGSPIMLIPNNQDRTNWQQSIRTKIVAYVNTPEVTTQSMIQQQAIEAKQYCRSVQFTQINTNTYRLKKEDCRGELNQIQIGKALQGKDAIYLVYYSAIPGKVDAKEILRLTHVIETAKLANDPQAGLLHH